MAILLSDSVVPEPTHQLTGTYLAAYTLLRRVVIINVKSVYGCVEVLSINVGSAGNDYGKVLRRPRST